MNIFYIRFCQIIRKNNWVYLYNYFLVNYYVSLIIIYFGKSILNSNLKVIWLLRILFFLFNYL